MKEVFAYTRVSTARQAEQGVSLPEQRDIIGRYAVRHGLAISRWFEDRITATVQGRPGFNRMLSELASKQASGVIIHKIDRSVRNLHDWNEVTELLDLGFDVHVADDSLDLRTRSGRLTGDMLAVMAADYSRNLREEVRKGLYGRLKQGLLPRPAPLGYRNNGGGQAKTIDPQLGPLVRDAFMLYASGRFSLRALAKEVADRGLRSRTGRKLRLTSLSTMLHNPFYAGVITVQKTGQSFPGIHAPLVSAVVFKRVQELLAGKAPRQARVHDFLFRRLLTCAHCSHTLIGESQKGRVYYRCQVADCPTTTVREDVAEEHLRSLLRPLRFTADHRHELQDIVTEFSKDEHAERQQRREAMRLRLANVSDRLTRVTDAYLEGALEKDDFEQRKQALLLERRSFEEHVAQPDSEPATSDTLTDFLELASDAYLLYEKALPTERRELVDILTSNRLVDGRTPIFTLSFPFCDLAAEAEMQTGGARPITARTKSMMRRLLKQWRSKCVEPAVFHLVERVQRVLHRHDSTVDNRRAA